MQWNIRGWSYLNQQGRRTIRTKGKSIWVHEMCGPQARAQDAEVSEGYHASKGEVLDKDPIKDFTEEEPW